MNLIIFLYLTLPLHGENIYKLKKKEQKHTVKKFHFLNKKISGLACCTNFRLLTVIEQKL